MNIYIAGPMRNRPEDNFPAFNKAAQLLRLRGHEVFNPAEKGCEEEMKSQGGSAMADMAFRRKVFALDWAWIAEHADAVAMLPGWEQSRGAVSEKAAADAIGLQVIYLGQEDGWNVAT